MGKRDIEGGRVRGKGRKGYRGREGGKEEERRKDVEWEENHSTHDDGKGEVRVRDKKGVM